MKINKAIFLCSNTDWKNVLENLPEYAFIGRSNVGKSSLINALTILKNWQKLQENQGKLN